MTEEPTEETVEKPKPKPLRYKLLTDLHYDGKKVKAGEIVDDLPKGSVRWLSLRGHIRKVK